MDSGHHCQQIICDMVLTKHEIDYEGVSFERSSFNLAFFEVYQVSQFMNPISCS